MNVANIGLIPKLSDLADWSHEVGAIPRSLEYELFWSGLWLEVYVATMYQKPFASLLHTDHIRQLIRDEQDERCWTNKMLLHLVDIIDYCFSGERSRRAYNKLQNDINSWQMSKPASFDPVSMISTEDGLFPPIWLLNDTVIAGLQYFHLARLLLLAHDPSMPLVGAALKKMNHERDVSFSNTCLEEMLTLIQDENTDGSQNNMWHCQLCQFSPSSSFVRTSSENWNFS